MGEFSFEIIKIDKNKIRIKTSEQFCLYFGGGINLGKRYDEFSVLSKDVLRIATLTKDIGDIYLLNLVKE